MTAILLRGLAPGFAAAFVSVVVPAFGDGGAADFHRTGDITVPSIHRLTAEDGPHADVTIPPGHTTVRVLWPAEYRMTTDQTPSAQAPRRPGLAPDGCVVDWNNPGGGAARTSRSDEVGPTAATAVFSDGRTSIIAWHPVIEDGRVFMVRQLDHPTSGTPDASPVVAMDLETGAELWAVSIPLESGDWTTWIAGVRNGVVYASNSGNGATVSAIVYGLDVVDGAIVWQSQEAIDSSAYDAAVFAADGDLVIGNSRNLMRIDSDDGSTVWSSPRLCSATGGCSAAIYGDSVYLVDAVTGGHMIFRHDLETGARQYGSSLMPGWTIQNSPMVGRDGTIYLSRAQNVPSTDFVYAFTDTGAALVERWNRPAAWTSLSEHAMTDADEPIFTVPGPEVAVLDPASGAVVVSTGVLAGFSAPRMAIDGDGTLFLSNREFGSGRLYAFGSDLEPLWDTAVTNINIGGPVIGYAGTVFVCGIGTDVRGYRRPEAVGACELFADGFESGDLTAWTSAVPARPRDTPPI